MEILETPNGQAGLEIIKFLADNEQFYESTTPDSHVAVLYSFATTRYYKTVKEETDLYGKNQVGQGAGNFTASFQGCCDALARSGIPYDVVTDLDTNVNKFDSYECIFLPTCACLSDKVIEKLKEFTEKGGTLVATFDTSLYDEKGSRRLDFGLKDVLGISFQGQITNYKNWNYLSVVKPHQIFTGVDAPLLPAPEFGLRVQVPAPSLTLAYFHAPMAGRYEKLTTLENPAIVLNQYGKGRAIYLAGTFAEMINSYAPPEYRKILANIARIFARSPVVLKNGGDIELVVRKQKKRLLIHLINYAGLLPRPFETVLVQPNLELTVAGAEKYLRVFALVDKSGCSVTRKKAALEIKVRKLQEYEVIVLEEK